MNMYVTKCMNDSLHHFCFLCPYLISFLWCRMQENKAPGSLRFVSLCPKVGTKLDHPLIDTAVCRGSTTRSMVVAVIRSSSYGYVNHCMQWNICPDAKVGWTNHISKHIDS